MTKRQKELFIGEWVQVAARVILTRRDDLKIVNMKQESSLDLQVQIERKGNPMRLNFGVILKAVMTPATAARANQILKPTLGTFQGLRKFTYPICLFFFTMREDQVFFSWLAEPTVVDGMPKLVHHDRADCVPFTNELLDQAIERIIAWYDAVGSVLIA
jgi:hypothetical protein